MDVGNMVDAWLEGKATHPETLRSYRFVIASFREALVSEKIDLTSEPAAVAAVLDTWMRRSIHRDGVASSSTQVKRLSIIDNFFAYANLPSPVKLVERPILPVSEPKSVDIAEIQEVLAQLRNEAQVRGSHIRLTLHHS